MRVQEVCRSWVVYQMSLGKGRGTGNVVCEQREWATLDAARPGQYTLLHSGVTTEQEAERLARGTSGDDYKTRGGTKPKLAVAPSDGRRLPVS